MLVAFALVRLAYELAVSSAAQWGDVVKSAFDLYLPALAHQLGYELPDTLDQRFKFWEAVAKQFQFFQPLRPEDWKVFSKTTGEATPSDNSAQTEGKPEEESDDAEGEHARNRVLAKKDSVAFQEIEH
ncbi:hypothetical protein DR64_112 [Paraburkholderia xenovorans LB400]|nr:hypothetical protein DR64_112 [Paraburkholderia xenovorans LB400]